MNSQYSVAPVRLTGQFISTILAALALLILLGPTPARASDPVTPSDVQAIRAVISDQIDAFRADDWPRAFSYASPTIQAKFRDHETFKRIVIAGYPAVYKPQEVTFEKTADLDGAVAQHVRVVGPDGDAAIAVYVMERQESGVWRIAGVYMTEPKDQMV